MSPILFTPERVLDSDTAVPLVAVKGQTPSLVYPFRLRDIYPTVRALDPLPAYQNIAHHFEHVDRLLHEKYQLRDSIKLPAVQSDQEALSILRILFDPTSYSTNTLWASVTSTGPLSSHFMEVSNALPFPFELASEKKLLHTLAWIDTNIKVNVEQALNGYELPEQVIVEIVRAAFYLYSLLIKQQNYWLARSINFNYSMFIQDRILNLLFGDNLFLRNQLSTGTRYLSNQIALDLLRTLGSLSFRQLCLASLFMGIIWTSDRELQRSYTQKPHSVIGQLQGKLFSSENQMGVDHVDAFLDEASSLGSIVVILDDNGESVFDLALCQQLLSEFQELTVTFVVNRFPVSNNISEAPFNLLLREPYFHLLHDYLASGRVKIVYEQQVFRSFEQALLSDGTLDHIKTASFMYIKGANFFETMRFPDKIVYHAFVVHGEMSVVLTGYTEGVGIFARIPRQKSAYIYEDAEHIITLKDQVPLWIKE